MEGQLSFDDLEKKTEKGGGVSVSNITIATVALAIFSVSSLLGGIVLIIMEVLDEKKEREREKRGRWFHSMDVMEEVEKMKGEEDE